MFILPKDVLSETKASFEHVTVENTQNKVYKTSQISMMIFVWWLYYTLRFRNLESNFLETREKNQKTELLG